MIIDVGSGHLVVGAGQGNGNVYRIAIMDRSLGGQVRFVSPGNVDDSPSFAPNASMLLYAYPRTHERLNVPDTLKAQMSSRITTP